MGREVRSERESERKRCWVLGEGEVDASTVLFVAEAKEVSILGGLAGLLLKGSSEVWGLGSGVKLLDGVPHWVMNDITRERGIV